MIRTVLVPLDGSPRCEHALPLAAGVARRAGAALRLVHVRRPAAVTPGMYLEYVPSVIAREQEYLDAVARRVEQSAGLAPQTALLDGPVVDALAADAAAAHAGLLVLTTHGRGPFTRFWLGSVADELVRRTPVPLLVHRPHDDAPRPDLSWEPKRILVPLDGSPFGECALGPALALGRPCGAAVTLLRVIEPVPLVAPDGIVPQPTALDAALLDELREQAEVYLSRTAERLRAEGVPVATKAVVSDLVAAAVIEEGRGHDLTAVATHARPKLARFVLGSVADKIVRGAAGPVLVVRPDHP